MPVRLLRLLIYMYQLKLQDSPDLYVAKCLFNPSTLNSQMNASSPAKNTQELEFEAQCLYYVKFFLDWFIKEARERGVDISTGEFYFSSNYLMKLSFNARPSP